MEHNIYGYNYYFDIIVQNNHYLPKRNKNHYGKLFVLFLR